MKRSVILGALLLGASVSCAGMASSQASEDPLTASPPPSVVKAGDPRQRTRIVMLGTGTPNADPDRSGSAVAIVVDQTPYLVDCGVGVVRRAAAAERQGVAPLAAENLRHLFITHLHSDHTLGLADLLLTPWILGRKQPLEIYGPPGTREMVDHILEAYRQDINIRTSGLEGANTKGCTANVHEIQPGMIYQDANLTVRAFPVRHGSWPQAFGFRFETADRTIVISGDTVPCQSLIDAAQGCDVLIHEVYSQAGFQKRPPAWQRYHSAFHTSAPQLAEIAKKVKPQLLILYHQLLWGTSEEDLLQEIRETYPGQVTSAHDLDIY